MLRLTTLGTLDLRDRLGRQVREVLSQPKRIALLVHLVLESRRGPVGRDRLVAMFWPESDDTRARNALSQALYHLRQVLGSDVIVGQGTTLAVAPEQLWCDATLLEDALDAGDADLALDLFRGEFCPALFVSGAPAAEEWLDARRRSHRQRLLDTVRVGRHAAEARGDLADAARLARQAMALAPDDEPVVREHLAAIARGGDVAGALSAYAAHARRLAAEFETTPAPETTALVEALKRQRTEAHRHGSPAARPAPGTSVPADPGATVPPAVTGPDAAPPRGEPVSAPAMAAANASRAVTREPASPPPSVATPLRRRALVAAALVLVAVWALSATTRLGVAPASATERSAPAAIAVFPFTVRGGGATAILGDGMADLLAAKLDGLDELRAIDPRSSVLAAEGRTPDPMHGAQLGRALGARYFVLGDLVERAGRVQVDGALYETARPRQAIATASVTGDTSAIFTLVDDVAGRLLAGLLTGRDSSLTNLAALTTDSLGALKAYLRGERLMRAGEDARAAAAFRAAVEIDSAFALAWYRLAVVANWVAVSGLDDPVVYATRAAGHAERLTPLARDLLQAFRDYKLPMITVADRYRAIVQAHPDNVEAWYMLAEAQFHYGPFRGMPASDARAAFERVLALQPSNLHAIVHLARLAAIAGDGRAADTLLALARARSSDAERLTEIELLRALARGDTVALRAAFDSARASDPLLLASIAQYAAIVPEGLSTAERATAELLRRPTSPAAEFTARTMRAVIPLAAGRWSAPAPTDSIGAQWRLESEALAAAEPSLGIPIARVRALRARIAATVPYPALAGPARPVTATSGAAMRHHLLALLDLRAGDRSSARVQADSLALLSRGPNGREATALLEVVRAEMVRHEGRTAEALAAYERVPSAEWPNRLANTGTRDRFAHAELLAAAGRTEEAARRFASMWAMYEFALVAPARVREGELLEQLGRRAEAATRFTQALALWRDADPELRPWVERARAGLARTR